MKDNEYRFTGPDGQTIDVKASHWIIAVTKALRRMKLLRAYHAHQGRFVETARARCYRWVAAG